MNDHWKSSLFASLLLSGIVALCSGADWPAASPEQVGLDETELAEAREYALRGDGSGCILRGGKMVMTWGDQKRRYDLYSSTKSIGVTALGLAIADGKVRLNDRAQQHLPSVGIPPESNGAAGWLGELTLFHLATQTGGFEKTRGWCRQTHRPGSTWIYSDGGPNWLSDCLTVAYGRDLKKDLMNERIFGPLGITVGDARDGGDHDLHWGFNNLDRPRQLQGINRRPSAPISTPTSSRWRNSAASTCGAANGRASSFSPRISWTLRPGRRWAWPCCPWPKARAGTEGRPNITACCGGTTPTESSRKSPATPSGPTG